ncbi:MAG: NAD(P)H-hydrate dehydratase, partial [Pyrinomonadaceae bacterium]
AQSWLSQTKFTVDSYKKTRGHALIVAGSKNMAGAAVLCADAAMQSGVGLVTIATPEAAYQAVSPRVLQEIMVSAVAETASGAIDELALEQVLKLSEKANAVAIGCGLSSNEESTRSFVRKFIEQRRTPVVIDADGLNALSPFDLQGSDKLPLILTPHIGEMRRLLGVNEETDLSDRVKIVREFAQKHHVILVLKGERSLIAAPDGKVVVNPTGNPGIGKAGNGDTLTGIIAGFIAQTVAAGNNNIFETVVAALYIAGTAGDIAAKKVGMRSMTASDVRKCLGDAFASLEG